jgi:hypothetical protein
MFVNKNQKNSKKKLVLSVAGIILALLLLLVVLEKTRVTDFIKTRPKATDTAQGPTPEQKQQEATSNADAKKQLIEDKTSDTPPSTTPPASSHVIELSTRQESNNTVTVFTKLTGYSNGNCSLTVQNGSKSTTQTAAVIYQPEFSSCAGFSVPIDSVGKGTWTLTLTVTSNGSSESKTISAGVN